MCQGLFARSVVLAAALFLVSCSKDPARVRSEAFDSGNRYFAAQQYKEAIVEFRRAIQADPNFGEARAKLGEAYLKTGELAAALRETVRAADLLPKQANVQIRAGNLLLAAGKYEDARSRAERVLGASPQNVEALVLRGNALAGQKDLDGALTEFEKAAAADPKNGLTLSSIGVVQMAKGSMDDAEAAFRKATEISPSSALARVSYANFLLAKKQPEAAEAELKKALAASPKDSTVRRALVVLYLSTGRPADAEPHLRAMAEDSKEPQARFALARFYMATNRNSEALKELKVLAANKESATDATLEMAALQYRTGQTAEGHTLLEDVLKQSPSNARARLLEAEFFVRERKWPEAVTSAKAAVDSDPRLVAAQYLLGVACQGKGDLEEAKQAFNEALRLEPNAMRTQLALAELHLVRRDAASALPLATTVAARVPQSLEARATLATAMLANGKQAEAADVIHALETDFPTSDVPYVLTGALQLSRKNFAAAGKSYATALQLNPASVPAARGRLQVLLVTGKTADARQYAEQLATFHSDRPEFLVLAGQAFGALRDYQKSEPLLRRALELDPSRSETYGLLAALYLHQGKLDQAIAEYRTLADKQPRAIGPKTMVGTILQMTNKRAEAKEAYRQVLGINGSAPVAANNLAWMLAEDNEDLDNALQLAQTAKAGLPDSAEASDTLGFVYLKKGLAEQAIAQFSDALAKQPTTAGFHYRLGFAYEKAGRLTDARKSLEQALSLDAKAPEAADARAALARLARLGS